MASSWPAETFLKRQLPDLSPCQAAGVVPVAQARCGCVLRRLVWLLHLTLAGCNFARLSHHCTSAFPLLVSLFAAGSGLIFQAAPQAIGCFGCSLCSASPALSIYATRLTALRDVSEKVLLHNCHERIDLLLAEALLTVAQDLLPTPPHLRMSVHVLPSSYGFGGLHVTYGRTAPMHNIHTMRCSQRTRWTSTGAIGWQLANCSFSPRLRPNSWIYIAWHLPMTMINR